MKAHSETHFENENILISKKYKERFKNVDWTALWLVDLLKAGTLVLLNGIGIWGQIH